MNKLAGVTFLILPILTACSANSENENTVEIPGYAGPGELFDEFIVNCGNVRTLVRGRAEDLFYTETGELKSQEEFCNEETVSTMIRR